MKLATDFALSASSAVKNAHQNPSVLVEPAAALSSLPARIHHLYKQGTRPVLGIAQAFVQHAHDVEADIESNEIGESQWSHRVRHPEFEYFVYGFRRGYSLHD